MASQRKHWLDWQRGIAVLFMIEVHVLDAWLDPRIREALVAGGSRTYSTLLMIGGFAAPGFLYMAGFSQALAGAALERKGVAPAERWRSAVRRGLWLLGVAYAFRLAEYLIAYAPAVLHGWWGSLREGLGSVLKVDVLNVIAVGLVVSALLSAGRSRRAGAILAGAAALAIALATPLVADVLQQYDLPAGGGAPTRVAPNWLVDHLLSYLWGSWPRAQFQLFNWVAFLLAGAALAPIAIGKSRPVLWLGIGAALYGLGWWADGWAPVYRYQDFWHCSPSWFAMRLGICAGITGLLQLVPDAAERFLSWLSLLGRQSLAGYIVSVELTYGFAAAALRKSLSFGATVSGMVAMVGVTWAISAGWERTKAWRKAASTRPGPAAPTPVA
jgi:heparan-alpha-glucosaminide N-acetyltransferase-like protein